MSRQKHKRHKTLGKRKIPPAPEILPALECRSWKRNTTIALLVVVALSLALNLTGINWGQPSGYSWNPDSVAGARTVRQLQNIYKPWTEKYPRFHFLILNQFYKPYINNWKKNPVETTDRQGRQVSTPFNTERYSKLVLVSRTISALMGVGAVIAVFMTARLLFKDDIAAIFSGLGLALTMHFVFYSHLGNMDVPCAFWFAWSLYWAVKAVYIGKWRHFVLLGLFSSLTVCTKEPAAGFVIGLGLAVWLAMTGVARQRGQSFKKSVTSVFNLKVLAAGLTAAFVFAMLNDLLTSPQAFFKRMDFWFKVGVSGYNVGITLPMVFHRTGKVLYYSFGWPLLILIIASSVYCVVKSKWKSAFGLLPTVIFFVVVILRTRLSIPRYFIPGYVCFMLLLGKGCCDLLRFKKLPLAARILPIAVVYVLSALYCIGIDLEMIDDTRYRAEKWLKAQVAPDDMVVALSQQAYAPRVQMLGCKYAFINERPKNDAMLRKIGPIANYLVLTEKEFTMPVAFDQEFLKELLAGSKGYKEVARFSHQYLYPKKTVFGFAGWPMVLTKTISPEIIILKKQ